jgi:maleate isomerase
MTTVGLIVPSSNLTIERTLIRGQVSALLAADIVVTRMPVVDISGAAASHQQFTFDALRDAALLLHDARPDVIVWTGTSALWRGVEEERTLLHALRGLVACPVISAAQGVIEALRQTGAPALGVLTPYVEDVHQEVLASMRALGFTVAADAHFDIAENFSFALIEEGRLEAELSRLALQSPAATAVVTICTNLPVAWHYDGRFVDSLVATLWLAGITANSWRETYDEFHDRLVAQLRKSALGASGIGRPSWARNS